MTRKVKSNAICQFRNEKEPGRESKSLQNSINYNEMVCHMKEHIRINSFSKFEKVWMEVTEVQV